MIQVTNRKTYAGMPWDSYFKVPGYSFSYLKNDGVQIPMTNKMRLGKLVDQYLFTPHEYGGEMRDVVVPIAKALSSFMGGALNREKAQLPVTADFTVDGLTMPFRGLIDQAVGKDLIVDLKVSELPPVKAIEYFRYDRQITGYCLAYGATKGIVLSINPKTKKISTLPIPLVTDWWCHKVREYGLPTLNPPLAGS